MYCLGRRSRLSDNCKAFYQRRKEEVNLLIVYVIVVSALGESAVWLTQYCTVLGDK